jgi:hypothetical protein
MKLVFITNIEIMFTKCVEVILNTYYMKCGNFTVDFVHFSDKRLPQKADPHEKRLHLLEMEREKKWLKMLKIWDHFSTTDKMRRRIYKGIPEKLRGPVWSRLLNIDTVKEEQRGKYEVSTKENSVVQTCHCSRSKTASFHLSTS